MNLIEIIKNLIFGGGEGEKKGNIVGNIVLIGLLGIIFIFMSNVFSEPETLDQETKIIKTEDRKDKGENYKHELVKGLQETISLIKGVGKVKVQVLFSRDSSYEYEYNQNKINKITNETDQNGGERKIEEDSVEKEMVIIRDANGNEKPVIRVETNPKISGVIVVAEGAEVSKIKYKIFRAISSYLDLPAYKINVLPYDNVR